MAEPPPPYAAAMAIATTGSDWDGAMKEYGYQLNGKIGGEFSLIDIDIWQHKDGHLLVGHRVGGRFTEFFIRADDVSAWSLDGYGGKTDIPPPSQPKRNLVIHQISSGVRDKPEPSGVMVLAACRVWLRKRGLTCP